MSATVILGSIEAWFEVLLAEPICHEGRGYRRYAVVALSLDP